MIAERGAFPVVLGLEARKLARAMVTRVATLAGLVLVTVATAGGYAAAMHAGDTDLGRKAASMVTSPGWDGYTALGATSVSATTLLAVGVVMSWSVGREFTDGTMVGLFAVPPTLRSIAAAKMVATLSWAALLGLGEAALLTTAGLLLGLGPAGAAGCFAVLVLIAVLLSVRVGIGHQGTKTKERQGIGSNQTAFGCDPIRIRGRDTHGSGLGNAARQGVIEGVVVLALILRLVVVGHSDHFKRR